MINDVTLNMTPKRTKYNVKFIPDNFMNSSKALAETRQFINEIELCRENQNMVNKLFKSFCNLLTNEMKRSFKEITVSAHNKKRYKPRKPYWDDKLNNLLITVTSKERNLRKCTYRANKRLLRVEYRNARHDFDRAYRNKKRAYSREHLIERLSNRSYKILGRN